MADKSIGYNLSEGENTIYQWHHVSGEAYHKNFLTQRMSSDNNPTMGLTVHKGPHVSIGTQSEGDRMQGIGL